VREDAAAADVHAAQSLTLKLEKMLLLQKHRLCR
jgi:hypothetical protein